MESQIRKLSLLTLILGTISFGWLILNIYYYNTDIVDVILGKSGMIVGIGYVILLGFYVSAFFLLFALFRFIKEFMVLRIITTILWIVSLISILIDKVMLDDLADAVKMGWEYGELKILNISSIIKIVFHVLIFVNLFHILTKKELFKISSGIIKDERIFVIANIFGSITGMLGLYMVIRQIQQQGAMIKNIYYLPGYFIILIPYALAVFYWLSMKVNEKITDWYDEKQLKDILISALYTLILSVPGLAIIFLFKGPVTFLWYPFYIFFVLLVFSSITLIQFKFR